MVALALGLSIRAAATRTGGGSAVLVSDGVLLLAATNKLEIRDTVTPANNYSGVPEAKITTTRASTAYYYDSAGVLQTSAINTHRLDYDPRLGGLCGYLTEDARVSVVRWSHDLTNVVWTPTNLTAVKDQTGPDGVANSATKITATGVNGIILQTTTIASSARWQSVFVKRLVGSGAVAMTMDNVTWTDVAVTAGWTRVEIPGQTLANPTVGLRLAVSGDSIAVWCMQNENGLGASSPVLTTSAVSTTRAADVPKLTTSQFPHNAAEFTLYAKVATAYDVPSGNMVALSVDDSAGATKIVQLYKGSVSKRVELIQYDTGLVANITGTNTWANLVAFKIAGGIKLNDTCAAVSGDPDKASDTVCTVPAVDRLTFGAKTVPTASVLSGWLFEAMYLPVRKTNAELRTMVS